MIDTLLEVLESVGRRRVRALTTAFGVFWGIFMLILLLAGGRGLRNGVDQIFAADAINSLWISSYRTSRPFEGMGAGRWVQLNASDFEAIALGMPELGDISPRRTLPAGLSITHGTRTASLTVLGIHPGYSQVEKTKRSRGRLLNALDVQRARKVALIGEAGRKLLFGNDDSIGQTISLGGIPFLVVGEFRDEGSESETLRLYIPYSTLTQTFDSSARVELITSTVPLGTPSPSLRQRIVRLLARRHRFDPRDDAAVRLWFAQEEYKKLQTLLLGINVAIVVVGLGTLISGMVGVSNILFVSVRERAQEFGLRRALGATSRSILRLVLAEALILASVAGGLGLCFGLWAVEVARRELRSDYFRDPNVDIATAFGALCVLVVTALVAGYFPAREAAHVQPFDALRRE